MTEERLRGEANIDSATGPWRTVADRSAVLSKGFIKAQVGAQAVDGHRGWAYWAEVTVHLPWGPS